MKIVQAANLKCIINLCFIKHVFLVHVLHVQLILLLQKCNVKKLQSVCSVWWSSVRVFIIQVLVKKNIFLLLSTREKNVKAGLRLEENVKAVTQQTAVTDKYDWRRRHIKRNSYRSLKKKLYSFCSSNRASKTDNIPVYTSILYNKLSKWEYFPYKQRFK